MLSLSVAVPSGLGGDTCHISPFSGISGPSRPCAGLRLPLGESAGTGREGSSWTGARPHWVHPRYSPTSQSLVSPTVPAGSNSVRRAGRVWLTSAHLVLYAKWVLVNFRRTNKRRTEFNLTSVYWWASVFYSSQMWVAAGGWGARGTDSGPTHCKRRPPWHFARFLRWRSYMPRRSPHCILVTEVTVTVETILFIIIRLGVCCSLNRLFMRWPGNLMTESALSFCKIMD